MLLQKARVRLLKLL